MTTTATQAMAGAPLDAPDVERRDAFAGRLFQATLGTMDLLAVYLGDRVGLYRALAEIGPATPAALAARTGTHERYVREWLEQQAVTGILDVLDGLDVPGRPTSPTSGAGESDAGACRYSLPAGHAEVLLARDSLSYLAYLGRFAVALGAAAPAVRDAFHSGGGVSWEAFGPDMREGQGEQNRPIFLQLMGREWLPAIPDVHARLSGPARPTNSPQSAQQPQPGLPARVADIACGAGWSSIAIALAYPNVEVDGFDLDAPSVEIARQNAIESGVADRVRFHVRDAAGDDLAGRYDLVLICEALHDLSRPVEALRTMRRLAGENGAVLVVDERVAETFTAPGDDLERLFYGFSVLCCLPAGMADQPSAGTGTVMRPAALRHYARQAGFRDAAALPIEHDLFRLYRLVA